MTGLDHRFVAWFSGLDLPVVTTIAKALSVVGFWGLIFIAVAAVILVRRGWPMPLLATVLAVIVAEVLSTLMKNLTDRDRPSVTYPDVHPLVSVPSSQSMPSGHAFVCFAAAVALSVVVPRARVPLVTLAALIALSRVYLGVHYLSDVVVGAALGTAVGLLVALGLRLVHPKIRADDHRDRGDQRQPDPEGGAGGRAHRSSEVG
jgi:undecaprenyl-diphosphatase